MRGSPTKRNCIRTGKKNAAPHSGSFFPRWDSNAVPVQQSLRAEILVLFGKSTRAYRDRKVGIKQ
ncbi:hypothetical protein EI94DRAFT_1757523 [Lactarius quietus]|nr:hypothetical protein EI94DRAFT_1757523 [Lactarius quietus]